MAWGLRIMRMRILRRTIRTEGAFVPRIAMDASQSQPCATKTAMLPASGRGRGLSREGRRAGIGMIWKIGWLGREDSNLRMAESKSAALPLGYAPIFTNDSSLLPHF
ncbi:hypothetical protein Gaha_0109_005 [Novacetimonas hansenii JCM 7643]|nr:hypothetical protein Gaha_0109_005 [Novacetimonas hansenii JCM 7643]GBQ57660.1 hypothetical protein AA0243_1559 [Novacetimonas hansenii NRIC 0243]